LERDLGRYQGNRVGGAERPADAVFPANYRRAVGRPQLSIYNPCNQ